MPSNDCRACRFAPDATSPETARPQPGRWMAGLVWTVLACGCCLLAAGGCSTVADPANPPSQRLKQFVNPLGARAEQEAFEERVKNDPFPAASRTGITTSRSSG